MSENKVIEAAKSGDAQVLSQLLASGDDVDQQDEQGWTALNWAAGRGDVPMVQLLLDQGADLTITGRDNRTALMIAKAADRREVAALLSEAERAKGVWQDPKLTRIYCKAYYLRDLRCFRGWSEDRTSRRESDPGADGSRPPAAALLGDDEVAYLHQDLTVTQSMWHGEQVIFDRVSPEWEQFCTNALAFAIPDDLL